MQIKALQSIGRDLAILPLHDGGRLDELIEGGLVGAGFVYNSPFLPGDSLDASSGIDQTLAP